jgi:hydroxyacyl-ACP dehydratase HTD2-like protein with hotdog domain
MHRKVHSKTLLSLSGDLRMSASAENLDAWLEKQEVAKDDVTAFPLKAMAATLDRTEAGDVVPPLWHWLYFLPVSPLAEAGQCRCRVACGPVAV